MNTQLVPSTPDEIAALPAQERGELITRALVESKQWLAVATTGTDPTPVAEFKAWAATVAEMTKQKGLAKEIQFDAQEMVRRAERGIGLTIRNGQASGEIAPHGGKRDGGKTKYPDRKLASTDFLKRGHEMSETYDLTDDVTEEQFEDALETAREEGNVSRANVIRKVQDQSPKIVAPAPEPEPDCATRRSARAKGGPITSRHKNRHHYVRAEQVHTAIWQLDALMAVLEGADEGLDPAITDREASELLDGLSRNGGAYRRLRHLLSERKDGKS